MVLREAVLPDPEPEVLAAMAEEENDPDYQMHETADDLAVQFHQDMEEYEQTEEYLEELRLNDPVMYEDEKRWRADQARRNRPHPTNE